MIVILGLIILVAAVIVGVAGVLSNGGSAHGLTHGFAVLGYHVTGSTGTLFFFGMVIGAAGLFGLTLLLAGARRTARRGSSARRGLKQSRRETAAVSQDRDGLIEQREAARASTASHLGNGTPEAEPQASADDSRHSRPRLPWHRPPAPQAAASHPEPLAGEPSPGIPAGSPARAE